MTVRWLSFGEKWVLLPEGPRTPMGEEFVRIVVLLGG